VIKVYSKIDYEILYSSIKDLSYGGYIQYRKTFIKYMIEEFSKTVDAAQKTWERSIEIIEKEFGFTRPVSFHEDAIRKRRDRSSF
jgi:hypothetical protein